MISKKAKYALKALRLLAGQYGKGPVMIAWLAEDDEVTCLIRPIMERVRDANLAVYEHVSLLEFAQRTIKVAP